MATKYEPVTAREMEYLALCPPQVCVRANPQRFVNPNGPEGERSIFVTVEVYLGHDILESHDFTNFGPLDEKSGIPLRVFSIGPGDRPGHSNTNENLPNFERTTYFARYGSVPLFADQFEVLWYFQEIAQDKEVPGFSEVAKEELMCYGTERPTYHSINGKHIYGGWTGDHYYAFCVLYRDMKVAQGNASWATFRPAEPLKPHLYEDLDECLAAKKTGRETATRLDMTLDDRIAVAQALKSKTSNKTSKIDTRNHYSKSDRKNLSGRQGLGVRRPPPQSSRKGSKANGVKIGHRGLGSLSDRIRKAPIGKPTVPANQVELGTRSLGPLSDRIRMAPIRSPPVQERRLSRSPAPSPPNNGKLGAKLIDARFDDMAVSKHD
ncbi:MAG: hypothetical protein M1827_003261 [Pycnora praestabilis]|nr:MAG: hypothetical protein M1827_003261 [Pycnora praestabilis]